LTCSREELRKKKKGQKSEVGGDHPAVEGKKERKEERRCLDRCPSRGKGGDEISSPYRHPPKKGEITNVEKRK